jgi:hypothetical protein
MATNRVRNAESGMGRPSGLKGRQRLVALMGCGLVTAAAMCVGAQSPAGTAAAETLPDAVQFNRDIRPILSDKCFKCHGPGTQTATLRFDLEDGAKHQLKDGRFAIVPGDVASSQMIVRVTATNPAVRMPRGQAGVQADPLSAREIALLKRWIEQGAVWQRHWSFIPPVRPSVPAVHHSSWLRNPIDGFVLQRLEQEGLEPSPEADRPTLLRRVTLDLTGLPPTPSELTAFLADGSPNAYEKVVDRLLHSPRYGERMAFPWLEAARYADSNGYQTDGERFMWRWRDWVIDAFNKNMPFDQFTIEQIAGDLLPNATVAQKIATGFNRNHRGNSEGGIIPEEYETEYLFDRVDTTGTVFLGLTVGCAKCHSHKYDPIAQKEYYQLLAYFNNVPEFGKFRRVGNSAPYIEAPTADQLPRIKALDDELAAAVDGWVKLQPEVARAQRVWEPTIRDSQPVIGGPSRGLVAYYPFDGGVGSQVFVEAPRSAKPVPMGRRRAQPDAAVAKPEDRPEPTLVAGVIGQAASFDGTSFVQNDADLAGFRIHGGGRGNGAAQDDVDAGATVTYDDGHTFAAWIYPTAPTGSIITRDENVPEPNGYGLKLRNGKLAYDYVTKWADESIQVETDQAVSLNQWHQITLTYGGSRWAASVAIYVDGQPAKLKILYDDENDAAGPRREPLRIGAGGGPANRFHGRIDEVRIYNRALSADEVKSLTNTTPVNEIAAMPPNDRTPAQVEAINEYFLEHGAPASIQHARRRLIEAQERRDAFHRNDIPTVMVMQEMSPARVTHLLNRGLYDKPGDVVVPAIPSALVIGPTSYPPNRLGLAKWLVDPANPLTARVTVNRFWQQYFGVGLVKTAEDFGSQGEVPSHPELLDWLATEFVRTGWNVKMLQKTIVMSATYRQASRATDEIVERDPDNRLLSRGPNSRLPAEMIRDQALALSGLLAERVGGPSVKPYQPDGLWNEIGGGTSYVQDHGPNLYRRSLYTFWKRTVPPPTMANFDASSRESCVVRPAVTNTPLQALDLMNNVTYVEAARVLAQRMMKQGGASPSERIAFGFKLATMHKPTSAESLVLLESFRRGLDVFHSNPGAAQIFVSHTGEAPRDETLDTSELAAYTHVASLLLNLNQAVMKE